jgi:hypothetical protein
LTRKLSVSLAVFVRRHGLKKINDVRILCELSLHKTKNKMSYHVNEKAIMVNLEEPTFLKCYIQMLKSYAKII